MIHVLDTEIFKFDKIISISSVPAYNEEAKKRGVTKVVYKDYQELDKFADDLLKTIKACLKI